MLASVHVKNLALIDEAEAVFDKNLNVLTGETGAGKSILIGAVNIALGGKASKDMIRKGAKDAVVELLFTSKDPGIFKRLSEEGIPLEGDSILITRRLTESRSVSRINGEVVSLGVIRGISGQLLDMHGQHEHQSLMNKEKHLEILDQFCKEEFGDLKDTLAVCFDAYKDLQKSLKAADMDKEQRLREISFIEFELNEIDEAALVIGEDDSLEAQYKKMTNAKQIMEALNDVHVSVGYNGAGEEIGRGLRMMTQVENLDDDVRELSMQLTDIDNLLNDFNRELSTYMDSLSFDHETFKEVEERLNLLNHLKAKYGQSIEAVISYADEQRKKLEKLNNFEVYKQKLEADLLVKTKELETLSKKLSKIRKKKAAVLNEQIKSSLIDMNFLNVAFDIAFQMLDSFSRNGIDDVEFMLSTNPGEPVKPLGKVASGGELSRVMLAIKSVLADSDHIESLIFDEIDTGISGRTAQMVAQKLAYIARHHQVLCITHLPQIAAMADAHYLIEKKADKEHTATNIYPLTGAALVGEIARLLGGVEITDAVRESASEMKKLADQMKSKFD